MELNKTQDSDKPWVQSQENYQTWYADFYKDMVAFLSDMSQIDGLINKANSETGMAKEATLSEALNFAMLHLFNDKMNLGQDSMSEQAYAIQDLSTITNLVSTMQEHLQSGNYTEFCKSYNTLSQQLGIGTDPWLDSQSATMSGGGLSYQFNFEGILGERGKNGESTGSALDSLLSELGTPAIFGSGTGLGQLTDQKAFGAAYYNLTGSTTYYVNGQPTQYNPPFLPNPSGGPPQGFEPANPAEAQEFVNDFSEATSQVSSASSYANNQLQYQQQNYQKITQSVQDTLSDIITGLQQINQNISST